MKILLAITLMLASIGFMGSWTEIQANAVVHATNPQIRIEVGRPRRRYRDERYREYRERDFRVVTQTRLVNYGWHTYRETYQTRYMPNGRTETTVISRIRLN
jgi:hypothetical protein